MTKSFLISLLIVLTTAIIEVTLLSNIYFIPVVPDLILICTIYFSLLNGSVYGELNGFCSGLILDFLTGVPLGFNCVLRTIMGYIYGLFSEHVIISKILIPLLTVSAGTIVKNLLIWLVYFLFPLSVNPTHFISIEFAFELCANTILAPLVFRLLGCFRKSLALHDEEDLNLDV